MSRQDPQRAPRGTVGGGRRRRGMPVLGAVLIGLASMVLTAPHASATSGSTAATYAHQNLARTGSPASSVALGPRVAPRHPLGNYTVNRYDGLGVAPGELRVDHVEDFAEIPAAQVRPRVNAQGAGAWAAERCARAATTMKISVDGRAARPVVRSANAWSRPGQAGLPTLRLECRIIAPASGTSIAFRNDGEAGSPGWREITAVGDRMTLSASDVPARSVSARLNRYPQDMLSSPLDVRNAKLRVRPGGAPASTDASAPAGKVLPRGADRLTEAFTGLIAQRELSLGFAGLALVIALALGALHALAPGHGKTIMAAYATAGGARAKRDVLTLGATVTLTHTAGVLILGLLIASGTTFAPAAIYPWLGMTSGALVAISGIYLLRRAIQAHRSPGHGHTHDHGHGHGHEHGHGHDHGHAHTASPGRGGAALMGFAGGLVPSPSAILVLVGAAAIGQAWFGVVLVFGYSIGLACTLILIGLFMVGSGRWLAERLVSRTGGRRASLAKAALPFGSAAAVVLLGLGLALRSLSATFT